MKSHAEHLADLANLEHVFGFNPALLEQTSEKWQLLRLGVFTASKAEYLISKKRGTKGYSYGTDFLPATDKDTKRNAYIADLVAEVASAKLPDDIRAKPMQWGRDHEAEARSVYEAAAFTNSEEIPFIFKDQYLRTGISPDGLLDDGIGGLELKCPWTSKVYIEFLADAVLKPEYRHQCQFSMWVSGRQYWHFANFDPRMVNAKKMHYVTVERCPMAMEIFDEAFASFIADMDAMLARVGAEFGQQWNPELHDFQEAA